MLKSLVVLEEDNDSFVEEDKLLVGKIVVVFKSSA
jgi:hypothetical protein